METVKYDGPELPILVALARRSNRGKLSLKEFSGFVSMLRTKTSIKLAELIAGRKKTKSKALNLKVKAIKVLAYGLPSKKKPAKVKQNVCPCCQSPKP